MIAILASKRDYTATLLLEYFHRQGAAAVLISDSSDFLITIHQTPTGDTSVRLRSPEFNEEFAGLINRLEWNDDSTSSEAAQFAAQETQAAIWAALALTSKPVVNRPSRWGFHPVVSRMSNQVYPHAFSAKPDIFVALRPDESRIRPLGIDCLANIYRVLDGVHMGRSDQLLSASQGGEVYRAIPYRREKVRRLLMAGTHLFDLFPSEDGVHDVSGEPQYRVLLDSLRSAEATFASIVIEEHSSDVSSRPILLQFSPFPRYEQFAHIDDLVFSSLQSFLMP